MIGRFPWDPFPHEEPDPLGPDPIHAVAFRGAVSGADAYRAVRSALRVEGELLRIGNRFVSSARYREVALLAFGNAANSQALAVLHALGDRVTQGFVSGPELLPPEIPFRSETVPVGWPGSPESERAATAAVELAQGLRSSDLLLVLLSPGALASLALPPQGISAVEWRGFLQEISTRGGTGKEVGLIARLLGTGGVGGRLAAAASEAEVDTFVVDRGDGATVVGGGPTRPPSAEERTAVRATLERLSLWPTLSAPLRESLAQDTTLPSSAPERVHRPVVVAGPGDALRGAADAVFDKKWRARLAVLAIPDGPEQAADRFVERTEEIVRAEPLDEESKTKGVASFAMTTLGLPEGLDEGPALVRFLQRATEQLHRREMSIGLLRTSGGVGDAVYPPGAAVGATANSSGRSVGGRPRGLRMRSGITDVGCLAVALVPRAGRP